jgi:glycosyltransferase involved in cell wall biosynthesis
MRAEDVRFSIIIPTQGRPELYATLLSIFRAGCSKDDEVIVVGDGEQLEARRIVECFRDRLNLSYRETDPTRSLGGPQRMLGISVAKGTHLLFIDDDDVYTEGALEFVRKIVSWNPGKISVFKMKAMAKRLPYDVIWREPRVYVGNIGTPMFCVPNVKDRLGSWGPFRMGDFAFIKSTLEKYPNGDDCLLWVDRVIAEIR